MDTDHDKIHTKKHANVLNANTKLQKTKKYLTPITSKRKKKKTKNNFLPDYTWILT